MVEGDVLNVNQQFMSRAHLNSLVSLSFWIPRLIGLLLAKNSNIARVLPGEKNSTRFPFAPAAACPSLSAWATASHLPITSADEHFRF